jgi:hypothetical protein
MPSKTSNQTQKEDKLMSKTGTIQEIKTKFTDAGALVASILMSDESDALTYYSAKGALPAFAVEGASLGYSVQEVVKGKFTNRYIRFDDEKSVGGAAKAPYKGAAAGGSYGKPMDPDTQARVTRLSCLSSAASMATGAEDDDEVIARAERFYIYATTGK